MALSRLKLGNSIAFVESLVCVVVATVHLRSRVRWILAALVLVMLVLSLRSPHVAAIEPVTGTELMLVATQFNHDYQVNDAGPVWGRFDARSRAVISRARYLRWHQECAAPPGAATTLGARRLTGGWWVVDYSISGVTLHDYWHQEQGRWRFSLVRSNPSSVALYSSSFAHYARAFGCVAS